MEEASFLQQIKLATDVLRRLGIPDDHLHEDRALLQIENAIKVIEGCSQRVDEENAKTKIAQALSSCGTASVFSNLMQCLRTHMNKKSWPCIMALRSACITLTNTFDVFCNDLCSVGFLVVLLKELKFYSKVHLNGNVSHWCVNCSATKN